MRKTLTQQKNNVLIIKILTAKKSCPGSEPGRGWPRPGFGRNQNCFRFNNNSGEIRFLKCHQDPTNHFALILIRRRSLEEGATARGSKFVTSCNRVHIQCTRIIYISQPYISSLFLSQSALEDVKPNVSNSSSSSSSGQPFNMYEAFLNRKEKDKTGAGAGASAAASTTPGASTTVAAAQAAPPTPTTTTDYLDESTFEAAGVRPRKPCNCTKSQCLKL